MASGYSPELFAEITARSYFKKYYFLFLGVDNRHFLCYNTIVVNYNPNSGGRKMLSEVQFFVSKLGEPCKVSNREWYITIFNCDGTLLEYADKDYLVIQAPNGHAHVNLPPGKYMAVAVWGYWMAPDGSYYGNHFTHKAIFQVCCAEHKCVWLYNPSTHECGIIYDRALVDLRANIDQTEADLIAGGVNPADPRFVAIADLRVAIDTNLPAVQEIVAQVNNFAIAFGHDLADGTDINRVELLNETDTVVMNNKVAANSMAIPDIIKLTAELTANVVKS